MKDRKQHDILIISSSEKVATSVTRTLADGRYRVIEVRKNAAAAERELMERSYDVAVINMPLTDEPGTNLAIDISTRYPTGVIIIASSEVSEDVAERVTDYGIIVVSKPVTSRVVSRSVRLMCALQDKLSGAVKKAQTLEEKMEEIRIVNRAKWLLIAQLNMDEPQAHRYLEKQAMDRCVPRREIAEEIIRTYS